MTTKCPSLLPIFSVENGDQTSGASPNDGPLGPPLARRPKTVPWCRDVET